MDLLSPEFSRMLQPCRPCGGVSRTLPSMFTVLENQTRECSTHGWSCRQATAVLHLHLQTCRSRSLTDCLRLPSSSWASLVAQLLKNPPAMQDTWVQSVGWEDPLKKGKAAHSSILAWRIPWTV